MVLNEIVANNYNVQGVPLKHGFTKKQFEICLFALEDSKAD